MGLDMYLTKRKYVKNWDYLSDDKKWEIIVKRGGILQESKLPVSEIIYDAAYWRKANAIHNWFVSNVQDGDDDCKEYPVSREQLEELLGLCKQVLATAKTAKGKVQNGSRGTAKGWEPIMEDGIVVTNPEEVAELLPPTEGFFFGSTDVDQYFLDDIKSTIEQLTVALEDEGNEFYYQSSW